MFFFNKIYKLYFFYFKLLRFITFNVLTLSHFKFFNFKSKIGCLIFLKKRLLFFKKKKNIDSIISRRTVKRSYFKTLPKVNVFIRKKRRKNFFYKFFDLKKSLTKILKENRSILQSIIFLKKIRQQKLTKKIDLLKKKAVKIHFFLEKTVFNCLIHSNLCMFAKDAFVLIHFNNVFVNYKNIKDPFFIVNIGDIIWLKRSLLFYKNFKKLIVYLKKKLWKLKHWWWFIKNQKDFFKNKASLEYPRYLRDFFYYKTYVPKNLEVDLIVGSAVYLKEKNFRKGTNFIFAKFISMFLFRLYNWKKL